MDLSKASPKEIAHNILYCNLTLAEVPQKRRTSVENAIEKLKAVEAGPAVEKVTTADLNSLTVAELREMAKPLPITGANRKKKADLIAAIMGAQNAG